MKVNKRTGVSYLITPMRRKFQDYASRSLCFRLSRLPLSLRRSEYSHKHSYRQTVAKQPTMVGTSRVAFVSMNGGSHAIFHIAAYLEAEYYLTPSANSHERIISIAQEYESVHKVTSRRILGSCIPKNSHDHRFCNFIMAN